MDKDSINMTNKKKKILTIVSIILLILIYFGYKLINLAIYDVNNMSIDDYNNSIWIKSK